MMVCENDVKELEPSLTIDWTIRNTFNFDREQNCSDLEVDGRKHFSDPETVKQAPPDLEVDGSKHLSDPEATALDHSNLEVVPGFGTAEGFKNGNPQAYHPAVAGNKDAERAIPYDAGDTKGVEQMPTTDDSNRKICGLKPIFFWMCIVVTASLVVGAVIGGVVGGTVSKRNSSSATGTTSATGNTSAASGAGASQSTSIVDTGTRNDSNLAALAWNVSSTHYQYRVYYQDDDNNIKESAFESSTGSWTVSKLVDGANVIEKTSVAASSSRKGVFRALSGVSFVLSPRLRLDCFMRSRTRLLGYAE